jgi:hypothetical protein
MTMREMILSAEIIGAAARAILTSRGVVLSSDPTEEDQDAYNASCDDAFEDARTAIAAALHDIEKAVREECAAIAHNKKAEYHGQQWLAACAEIEDSIRALPPSTESQL